MFNVIFRLAIIITIWLIFLYGYLWFTSADKALKINEIGDALAGLSTTLAFIWIIVTVFLQKDELMIQRAELTEMVRNAKSQAESLHESLKCQVLETLRQRFKDKDETLNRLSSKLEEVAFDFVKDYGGISDEVVDEFRNKACVSIGYSLGYFFKTTDNISAENFKSELRNDFEHKAFLYLESILRISDQAWRVSKSEFVLAEKYDLFEDCESWIASYDLLWITIDYKFMKDLYYELCKIVSNGGGDFPHLARNVILVYEKIRVGEVDIEIPFTKQG